MTTASMPPQPDVETARKAGAHAADLVIRLQLSHGMSPEEIRASAERVLGDRFTDTTPARAAFYGAYDEVASTYTAEMRELFPEPGDVEAG
jgi:hypothetical protein